jgi:hypothetical protein
MSAGSARQPRFQRDAWGRLLLVEPGCAEGVVVDPIRCFPLTHPREHIALVDSAGKEVLRIAALDELPADQRTLIEEALAEREFSPLIRRIARVSASSPPCTWDVETDRGPTQFELDSEDDVRKLPDGAVIVADANGIRYRISDVSRLDASSRALLRRFL